MKALIVSDLHWGHTGTGFQVERVLPRAVEVLLPHWRGVIEAEKITLLVITGDLVHHGTRDEIHDVISLLATLPCDALVCLGNHDLMRGDALDDWRSAMAAWPRATLADPVATAAAGTLRVVAVTSSWWNNEGVARHWIETNVPVPVLSSSELVQIDRALAASAPHPTALVIHAPPAAIFPPGSGIPGVAGEAYKRYADQVQALLNRHPHVFVTASGHVHYLCTQHEAGRTFTTLSAVSEKPHLGRVIANEGTAITCRVIALAPPEIAKLSFANAAAPQGSGD